MAQYWFKPKQYGWGFDWPIAWQGWVALACLIILILISALVDGIFVTETAPKGILRFVLDIVTLSCLFCLVFQDRVEGGLKWRWGRR